MKVGLTSQLSSVILFHATYKAPTAPVSSRVARKEPSTRLLVPVQMRCESA